MQYNQQTPPPPLYDHVAQMTTQNQVFTVLWHRLQAVLGVADA